MVSPWSERDMFFLFFPFHGKDRSVRIVETHPPSLAEDKACERFPIEGRRLRKESAHGFGSTARTVYSI